MKARYLMMALLIGAGSVAMVSCNGNKKAGESDSESPEAMITDMTMDAVTRTDADSLLRAAAKGQVTVDSVYTTESGLKYMVVKEGTGAQPTATDAVTVHYTGKLLDGTVFDSSVVRGEPATFPLNQVIPGWTEGVQLMKEGGKTIFYIPSGLAYGPQGAAGVIPPNSDLIFEVELLKIEK